MAHCTKQSVTYKRVTTYVHEFELEEGVTIKLQMSVPFPLDKEWVKEQHDHMADRVDRARMETEPHQSRLFQREPVGAGSNAGGGV